jgi:epoxyqueuosine reductase
VKPVLLVHACCGECAATILEPIRRVGAFALYFHNPNIHPLIEFRRRLKSVQIFAERLGLDLVADDRYDLKTWLRNVPWDRPARCLACYRERLAATAAKAAQLGCSAITTTLLASVHQDHEAVRTIGQEEAAARGLTFHYEDWRPLVPQGQEEARRLNLYRQQYCGCIFSEEERFAPTRLHLYRSGADADEPGQGGEG